MAMNSLVPVLPFAPETLEDRIFWPQAFYFGHKHIILVKAFSIRLTFKKPGSEDLPIAAVFDANQRLSIHGKSPAFNTRDGWFREISSRHAGL
ncbi:hypothetical protein EYZ11_001720 [Aspergillus tanneri]|uniref:Uncharacterized protein n=1 Tax=Aspergillus tanneri TaxID=1220188 RepID=A0A4S3JSP5_9EURO|nr:hypothetical protein EYZ11_001720 [Aspergillus tanneri]